MNFEKIPKNPSNFKSKVTHQNLNSIESIQNITLMKATVAPHPPIQAEDEEHAGALQRYKMVDARLRRLCERKPSGKLNVPQAIHDQWMAGGKQRDELRALFESYDFDKDSFKQILLVMLCSCNGNPFGVTTIWEQTASSSHALFLQTT